MALTLQIVGHKKTGKTLIMTRLVAALTKRGQAVVAIKHDAHQAQMDQPGTDSDRLAQAGANLTILNSVTGSFYHYRKAQALAAQIATVPAGTICLIEGHKAAPYPKLVLLANNEPPATWRDMKGIIAFASLTPRPDAQLIGPMAIVNWLTELLLTTNPEELIMSNDTLTHFNAQHRAKMVDVTDKQTTSRKASATGQITMHPATLARIKEGKVKKGDVLAVAQVAGIMAAKKTSELIPMCHLIPLTGVDLSFSDNRTDTITVTSTVKTKHVTGVEIEALTAVQICLLTIYDMCKAMDRGMVISDVHLLEKEGGKSGHFVFQP